VNGFFASLGPPDYFATALALLVVLVVAWARHSRHGLELLLATAFLPLPGVALFSRQFNVVGWHAFMHASPIYQIMERGGVPPEDPLYAGEALRYPWVEFWLTALGARGTGVSPIVLTLFAQACAYAVLLGAAVWLASAVTEDRLTIGLAALLSAFGISIFHSSVFAEPVQRAFPPLWLESRVVPLDKFLSVTAMPLGYAAMLLAAAAGVRLAAGRGDPRRLFGTIAGGTLVAVFIHPLSWLGILVAESVVGVVLWASRSAGDVRRIAQLAVSVLGPSLIALPYLRSIGASESSEGKFGVTPTLSLFEAKLADLGFFLATFALLAYLERTALLARLRKRERAAWVVLLVIICSSVAYLVVRAPGRNEYKFLLQLVPFAALGMALSLRSLLDRHRALGLLLVFFLVLPGGRVLGDRPWFEVTDPARLEGQYQRALDSSSDELYQWVAHQTPADAVFVAADLRMPPLGHRSLYVAVDAPWRGRDGWGLARNSLLQWHVRRPDREMYRRQQLATIVLSPGWAAPASTVLQEIQAAVPGRRIFVHAALPGVSAKLDRTVGFQRRFGNAAGVVHEWSRPSDEQK
jgi:hypothetical protein